MVLLQPHSLVDRVEQLREKVKAFPNARLLTAELQKNSALKDEVRAIYQSLFGKQLTGCTNCITDAAFEILNKKNIMEKGRSEYLLPAGALLHDVVNMDSKKAMSNANISEELALYHLATNPGCEERFIRLPEDWKERVEAYRQQTLRHRAGSAEDTSEEAELTPKLRARRSAKKSTEKTNE